MDDYKSALSLFRLRLDENVCKCGAPGTPEDHTCPYDADINDDDDSECNCCKACTEDCAHDV